MKTYRTENKIKKDIIKAQSPVVIIGKNNRELNETVCRLDKDMKSISVLNLDNISASNKYNPFAYIKTDTEVEKATEIILNTTDSLFSEKDTHKASETALLQALIFYLKDNDEIPKEYKNFSDVMKLLNAAEVDEDNYNVQSPLDRLIAKVEAKDSGSLAVKQYKIFKLLPVYEQKLTVSGLAGRLLVYSFPEMAEITDSDEMDLESFPSSNRVIVLIYGNTSRNHLINLFLWQLSDIVKTSTDACSVSVFSLLNGKRYTLSHKTDVTENFINTAVTINKVKSGHFEKEEVISREKTEDSYKNIADMERREKTFKETNATAVRDAINKIVLKKGEVIVNEKENPETGVSEYDYDIK